MPFRVLGASLLAPSGTVLTLREQPWGAILALRDHSGRPGEPQDGHEVVRNKFVIDLGAIFGPYRRCVGTEACLPGLVSRSVFLSIYESTFRRSGLRILGFVLKVLQKTIVY